VKARSWRYGQLARLLGINDFFLDGIRDAAVYTRDSFNLQSVEVVKGPRRCCSAWLHGGAINQVKAPFLQPLDVVTANLGTNDLYDDRDVNQPFSDSSAFRVNVMGESSQVADRDLVRNRRWGFLRLRFFGIGTPIR